MTSQRSIAERRLELDKKYLEEQKKEFRIIALALVLIACGALMSGLGIMRKFGLL